MNLSARNDWANAWRNPIPTKIEDISSGIMIDLTDEDIESIKAQLAMEHFKELFDIDFAKNFENDFDEVYQSRIKGITHEIKLNEILTKHKEWIHHPVNLIDGVNQIDQYFFPNITRSYVDNEIKSIVEEISILLKENMSALEKVSIINDVLYEEYKFRGDKRKAFASVLICTCYTTMSLETLFR